MLPCVGDAVFSRFRTVPRKNQPRPSDECCLLFTLVPVLLSTCGVSISLRNCWLTHGHYWKAFIWAERLNIKLNFLLQAELFFFFSFSWFFFPCIILLDVIVCAGIWSCQWEYSGSHFLESCLFLLLSVLSSRPVSLQASPTQPHLLSILHLPLPVTMLSLLSSFSLIFHNVCSLNLLLSPLLGCLQAIKPLKLRSV